MPTVVNIMGIFSWRCLPLLLSVLLCIILWRGLALDPQKLPSAQLGHQLPTFKLSILGNQTQQLTNKDFHGQIALLSVWASWCTACVEEQMFLMQLAHIKTSDKLPIFGINYKDDTATAKAWLSLWGNPYDKIGEDRDGNVAIDLGVYGAPEIFLIDQNGVICFRHVGGLDEASWKKEFLPRIRQLRKGTSNSQV